MDFRKLLLPLPLILAISFTYLIHSCELDRSKKIKLYFSEISQIKRDYAKEGKTVNELTLYLTELNDMCMKIFEGWIFAKKGWSYDPDKSFAWELDMLTNKTFKYHKKDLEDLFIDVVKNAKALQLKIKDIPLIIKDIQEISSESSRVWSEYHDDHYHTEYYTVRVCNSDSKGKQSCHSERRSRQVYDYTIHTYTYRPNALSNTISLLNLYLGKPYDIPRLEDDVKPASKTNADGEYAVERTVDKEQKDYSVKNYKKFWIENSTYLKLIPGIRENMAKMISYPMILSVSALTSKSSRYKTYSHYDTPPSELTLVKNFTHTCYAISGGLSTIWDSINYVKNNTPKLKKNIMDFIAEEVNYEKDKKDHLDADDILDLTGEIHHSNFIGAEKVESYRKGWVITSGILLILLACGATFFLITEIFS